MSNSDYPRDISALIVIDPLNDFLDEKGKLHSFVKSELKRTNFYENMGKLISGARAAKLQVVYAPHGVDEHSFDDVPFLHDFLHKNTLAGGYFKKGTWGAEFYEAFKPEEGDLIASQHRLWNSFRNTTLGPILKERGIQKVAIAGMTSHKCVESTGRHAVEEGYHVTFVTDATAEYEKEENEFAIKYSFATLGHAALTVDQFLAALN